MNNMSEEINEPDINNENISENTPEKDTEDIKKKEDITMAYKEEKIQKIDAKEWFKARHWSGNPFTFNILPSILVGYNEQKQHILLNLEEKHKFILVSGPTGSGKTTLMKWVQGNLSKEFDTLYISKPPKSPEQFVEIFNDRFRKPWFLKWLGRARNIYQLPDFLNKKLRKRHLVVLFDEAHESSTEVLEWLRVLGDQVDNISFLMSGLPVFEDQLISRLETFSKRIAAKIELLSLTKEETKEMIRRRIQNAGGSGSEFNEELMNAIYEKSGGFPREIIRLCDEAVNNAIINSSDISIPETKVETVKEERITVGFLDKMTPMQKEIIELLSKKPLSPGQIANSMDLGKYKSRQHAVRSVNNIVKKLQADGYLERTQQEKTFVYSLTPKIRTLMVKA